MTGGAPHPAALPVACPFCYMGPGEPCVTTSDNPCRYPHRVRVLAAYRAGVMDSCGDCGGTGVVRMMIYGRQDRLVPTAEPCGTCGGYVEPGANPEREDSDMPTHQIETENWLDIMPILPLDRAVPVLYRGKHPMLEGAEPMRGVVLGDGHTIRWDPGKVFPRGTDALIYGTEHVDAGDPQGQRYAAGVYLERASVVMPGTIDAVLAWLGTKPWLARCLAGAGSTEDVLQLATALREVTS